MALESDLRLRVRDGSGGRCSPCRPAAPGQTPSKCQRRVRRGSRRLRAAARTARRWSRRPAARAGSAWARHGPLRSGRSAPRGGSENVQRGGGARGWVRNSIAIPCAPVRTPLAGAARALGRTGAPSARLAIFSPQRTNGFGWPGGVRVRKQPGVDLLPTAPELLFAFVRRELRSSRARPVPSRQTSNVLSTSADGFRDVRRCVRKAEAHQRNSANRAALCGETYAHGGSSGCWGRCS